MVINLISQILHDFNENKYALDIFINLSKAFDVINHDMLLKKLDMYDIKGDSLKWFHSCLTSRKQFIKYSNQMLIKKFGVAQGSIPGPLLFFIYVNDFKKIKLNYSIM